MTCPQRLRLLLSTILSMSAAGAATAAPTETVLHAFCQLNNRNCTDGKAPRASLVDNRGTFYGTTTDGGAFGNGTIFKISPAGKYAILHSFDNSHGSDPHSGLIADKRGNMYGAALGNVTPTNVVLNYGVLYKITESGVYNVLHYFHKTDGAGPFSNLLGDRNGSLYGTTIGGGASNYRTVFKLGPNNHLTVLHSFNFIDGWQPMAGVVADNRGNLYGTTYGGGKTGCGAYGCGVAFRLSASGRYVVLHNFTGGTDGANPIGGLQVDSLNNLYGTTRNGGGANNIGTVFMISAAGQYKVLHSFAGGTDGANPSSSLISDRRGHLYGTTFNAGGQCGGSCGTIFDLAPGGPLTTLYAFHFPSHDGSNPAAGLINDQSGNLYGTTAFGGSPSEDGTVFKLTGTGFTP